MIDYMKQMKMLTHVDSAKQRSVIKPTPSSRNKLEEKPDPDQKYDNLKTILHKVAPKLKV